MSSSKTSTLSTGSEKYVVLQGYHKKLKTMKKKYFVLFSDSVEKSARLEYYDTEKKYKSRFGHPKRTIVLNRCFHINRRLDTKHKYVISLYTKDDCFCIVFETEGDLNRWLKALLSLHRVEESESGDKPRGNFEHVWQVQVQRRGLAEEKGIIGNYHLCLTDKSLTLARTGPPTTLSGEARMQTVEFLLTTIRRCGDSQCYFYMEVGRHSVIGAGELWMGTEDPLIAQNMHVTIINAMTLVVRQREDFNPMQRNRSSSANEASKPILMLQRRQTHVGAKPFNISPSGESPSDQSVSSEFTVICADDLANVPKSTSTLLRQTSTFSTQTSSLVSTSSPPPPTPPPQPPTIPSQPLQSSILSSSITAALPNSFLVHHEHQTVSTCHPSSSAVTPSVFHHQSELSLPNQTPFVGVTNNILPSNIYNVSPQNSLMEIIGAQPSQQHIADNNNMITTSYTIEPNHQRTRSLPLTEETAIQVTSFYSNSLSSTSQNNNDNFTKCCCSNSKLLPNNNNVCNQINSSCSHNNQQKQQSCSFLLSSSMPSNQINTNHPIATTTISNFYNRTNNFELKNNHHQKLIKKHDNIERVIDGNNLLESTNQPNSLEYIITADVNPHKSTTQIKHKIKNKSYSSAAAGVPSAVSMGGSPLLLRRSRGNANCTLRSSAIVRERCDSLPSRNRTTSENLHHNVHNTSMPPPRSIPSSSIRPHSMYNHRNSHSPPMHIVAPLSPSAGCSESDGSSLSIDEPDGYSHSITPDEGGQYGLKSFYNSRTSGSVIPEENPDDCWFSDNNKRNSPYTTDKSVTSNPPTNIGSLSLPIQQNQVVTRKGSPAPPSNYIEMYSPSGSSPGDHQTGSGYMMMSSVDYTRSMYTSSSGAHSRASSLAEEIVDDGYVLNNAQPPAEEYVDMEQSQRHHTISGMSSAESSCSITSGTPSTDMRFAEYQLDKVVSRFTPDDEDTSLIVERPARAYSVGSRLEHNKRKYRVDLLAAEHNDARARAFSLGSRAKVPRSDRSVIQTSHLSNITQETVANETNNNYNSKSSSAPMLINKMAGSIDPMDDLMEIDFTSTTPTSNPTNTPTIATARTKINDLLISSSSSSSSPLKMSLPVSVPNTKKYDSLAGLSPSNTFIHERSSGYLEMKPAISHHEQMFPIRQEDGYLEMKPVGNAGGYQSSSSLSTSPIKSITSPKTKINATMAGLNRNNNYMDMSPRIRRISGGGGGVGQTISQSPQSSSDDYLNMSPCDHSQRYKINTKIQASRLPQLSNTDEKSMEVDLPKTLSAPEGYMEMYWVKPNANNNQTNNFNLNNNNNNNVTEKTASDEYISMNFNRKTLQGKNEPRLSSLPIAIQLNKQQQQLQQNASTRKNVLPFISDTNAQTRCDSKDSGIITPSGSHTTIFPFSPGSPSSSKNPLDEHNLPRKCLVDGTTGTLRLTEVDRAKKNITLNSPDLSKMMLNTDQTMNASNATLLRPQLDVLSNDYADMTLGTRNVMSTTDTKPADLTCENSRTIFSDYVNCTPLSKPIERSISIANDQSSGDYAFMNPALTRKLSVPLQLTATTATTSSTISSPSIVTPLPTKKALDKSSEQLLVNLPTKKTIFEGFFKPITSISDECDSTELSPTLPKAESPKPLSVTMTTTTPLTTSSATLSKQKYERRIPSSSASTTPTNANVDASGYELLQMRSDTNVPYHGRLLSRPNSVNSDNIVAKAGNNFTRPNSANSDCLPVISASSSSSTLYGSSSSSTTLCGSSSGVSKSQCQRPQSCTDSDSNTLVITSRPPSVSSERELNYASLDLPPSSIVTNKPELENNSATNLNQSNENLTTLQDTQKLATANNSDQSSTGVGLAVEQHNEAPAFTYAQIDFEFKNNLTLSASGGSSSSSSPPLP